MQHQGKDYPEYLCLFSDKGEFTLKIKFKNQRDRSRKIATLVAGPKEVQALFDPLTGMPHKFIYLDSYLSRLLKIEIDVQKNVVMLTVGATGLPDGNFKACCLPIRELLDSHHGAELQALGIVTDLLVKITKSGTEMAFGTFEDCSAAIGLIIFPDFFEKYSELLTEPGKPLIIKGKYNDSPKSRAIVVSEIHEA